MLNGSVQLVEPCSFTECGPFDHSQGLICWVGQNHIYTLYMTVYLVIPCQKYRIYTAYIYIYIYGSGQPYSFDPLLTPYRSTGQQHVIGVVCVDPASRACWQMPLVPDAGSPLESGGLDSVMDSCAKLKIPLVAIPVARQPSLLTPSCARPVEPAPLTNQQQAGSVVRKAMEVIGSVQQRHLQQHHELELDGGGSGSVLQVLESRKEVVFFLAWVSEAQGQQQSVGEGSCLPQAPWLKCGDEQAPARGTKWEKVASDLELTCL